MTEATAREELAWIRSLMDQSQAFLCGTWRHQLLWGVVGTVGLAGSWNAVRVGRFTDIPWIWLVALGLGWVSSMRVARHQATHAAVRSVAARAFGGIWLALGVSLTLLGAATIVFGAIDPPALSGIVAIIFGAGYFASGFTAGLRWIQAVGVAWWIGGAALLIWRGPDAMLVLAGMTLLLEVGPALRLRSIEREQTASERGADA